MAAWMPGAVDEEEKARALREIESYGKEEQVRDRAAGGERGGRREREMGADEPWPRAHRNGC